MKRKTTIGCLLYLTMIMPINSIDSQNLIDTSTWTLGSGVVDGFKPNGEFRENSRSYVLGPFRATVIVWKATPNNDTRESGGFNTRYYNIDYKEI